MLALILKLLSFLQSLAYYSFLTLGLGKMMSPT